MKAVELAFKHSILIVLSTIGFLSALFPPVSMLAAEVPEVPGFHVTAARPGAWPGILSGYGLQEQTAESARVIVLPEGGVATTGELLRGNMFCALQ